MAIGEKYAPLGNWLKEHGGDSVKLTFDELNQIIPIPNHAYKNRPSWANLSNPASFCSSWISAGYVVDSISLEEQWVVFRKGEVQGHTHHSKPPYRVVDQKKLAEAIQAGYECYDSMKDDLHHRYLSWEYCHEAFRLNRRPQIDATIDYLCLHLAWYLASWGMLRNSFLMQKDYKIHADVVRLIYQPEWDDLWDLSPEKLSQEYYADRIMKLSESITEAYVAPVPASQRIPCLPRSCWVLWAACPPMIGISKRLLLIPVLHPKFSVRNPSEPLATYILTMRMSLKSSGNIAAAELSIRQPKSWTCAFLSMASRETRAAKKTAIRLFCEEGSLWNML